MSASSRVRVYMACSLDGFIAGPNDDLSWLEPSGEESPIPPPPTNAVEFDAFMNEVGVLLMGRRTYDVVAGLGSWIYGETAVLVVTHRPLPPSPASVRPVAGDIAALVTRAKEIAGDKDVYLDGGALIRQALDADLVDEMIITFIPILLAGGTRLFDGLVSRRSLKFVGHHAYGHDKVQIVARIRK